MTDIASTDGLLTGHCALIAGASHGPGLAVAGALAALGCDLHLAGLNEQELQTVAGNIAERFAIKVETHATDLSQPINAAALMLECDDADILVCAFGSLPGGDLEDLDDEDWRRGFGLKVFATINLCTEFLESVDDGPAVIAALGGPQDDGICTATANAALQAFSENIERQNVHAFCAIPEDSPDSIVKLITDSLCENIPTS